MCHLPSSGTAPFPVVVICHGLGGNKIGQFQYNVLFSEMLAEYGIASVRFDFRGSGDSEGEFAETTLEKCVVDTCSVLECVQTQALFDHSRQGIYGCSFDPNCYPNLV